MQVRYQLRHSPIVLGSGDRCLTTRGILANTSGGSEIGTRDGSAISSAVGALLGMPDDWHGFSGMLNAHWTELIATRGDFAPSWRMVGYNLGPTDASADWNAGPDTAHDADSETRDPD